MEIQLSQRSAQSLSPQMIASMEVLQMGAQELLQHLEAVVQESPVPETADPPDAGEGPRAGAAFAPKELPWTSL